MKLKTAFYILTAITAVALTSPTASAAEDPESAAVKKSIVQFYQHLGDGDMKAAFAILDTESSGFLPAGMSIEIRNESAHARATANAAAKREAGRRVELRPKHISVRMLGADHAVASFYADGTITEGGESSEVIRRVSFVLHKKGDAWKIVHWHISNLEEKDTALAAK